MTVAMSEGPTSQLLGELQMQRFDALIGRSSWERTGAGLTRETVMQQDACLLAHLQNARVRKRGFGLADLEGARWLLPPRGTPTRTTINVCFAAAGLEPPLATVEASSSQVIHHVLAAHPDMLSIVPSEIGHDVARLGRVRRHAFPVPLRMPAVGLVSATRHRDTPVVRNLRNAVRTAICDCGYTTPAGPITTRGEPRRRTTGRDALRARGER